MTYTYQGRVTPPMVPFRSVVSVVAGAAVFKYAKVSVQIFVYKISVYKKS